MTHDAVYFFGDIAIDEYWRLDAWPRLGDKATGDKLESQVGGMVSNAARIHASLGGHAEFVTVVRPDEEGRRMLDALQRDGVSTAHVIEDLQVVNGRTQVCTVGDDHTVLIQRPDPAPIWVPDRTWRSMCTPGWLVANLPRLHRLRAADASTARRAVEILAAAERRIIVDADVDDWSGDDLAAQAAVVITNDHGFRRTFGDHNDAAFAWLDRTHTSILIRTRGPHGATAYTRGGTIDVDGYIIDVADVTGAGDAFTGSLAYALAHNWETRHALELAAAVSARSVGVHGPVGGRAQLHEMHTFMAAGLSRRQPERLENGTYQEDLR